MAKFHDTLNSLGRGEDGVSVAYPETFMDDISSAYDEDFTVPAAKIQVLESENADLVAQVATLKAHNYDLLMQIPTAATLDEDAEENNDDDSSDSDDDDDKSDVEKVFAN